MAHWFVGHTPLFLKKTTEATHGTKRFDLRDIIALPIGIANITEQRAITEWLESVSIGIQTEQNYVAKLRQLKHGLMHDLLTGRVRVKIAEPAELSTTPALA